MISAYNNLGYVHIKANDYEKAVAAFREHGRMLEGLAADFPSIPDYQDELAVGCGNLAASLKKLGKRDEAVP